MWILTGPIIDLWYDDFSKFECTYEQFLEAVDGVFTLNYDKIDARNPVTIANMVRMMSSNFV